MNYCLQLLILKRLLFFKLLNVLKQKNSFLSCLFVIDERRLLLKFFELFQKSGDNDLGVFCLLF